MKFLLFAALIVLAECATIKNYKRQNPHLYQGDILLENEDAKHVSSYAVKWPGGIIPYIIDSASGYTPYEMSVITNSMRTIESQIGGCLTFVPRTTESYYLMIKHTTTGCNSYIGRRSLINQPQTVSLQRSGCVWPNVVVHELLHAAGFEHEHCRADRDSYIDIIWNNVSPDNKSNFDKISGLLGNTLGLPYDYYSVMHYERNAFSVNRQDTITAKIPGVNMNQVGIRGDLSPMDIQKVMKYYNCTAKSF